MGLALALVTAARGASAGRGALDLPRVGTVRRQSVAGAAGSGRGRGRAARAPRAAARDRRAVDPPDPRRSSGGRDYLACAQLDGRGLGLPSLQLTTLTAQLQGQAGSWTLAGRVGGLGLPGRLATVTD